MKRAYIHYSSRLDEGHIPKSLENWCAEQADTSPQFQFWFIILQLELAVLIYLRLVGESNFLLNIGVLSRILPWFFAMGHTNYAKWFQIHFRDTLTPLIKYPNVYEQPMAWNFLHCEEDKVCVSAIAIDQAHNQNNASVRGDGGGGSMPYG